MCSSDQEDFVPLYDPEGTVYNRGPQFGCIKPDKSLTHRYILLDKNFKEPTAKKKDNIFQAEFTNTNEQNLSEFKNKKIVGGFKFNIDGLFIVSNSTQRVWFIQIVFQTDSTNPTLKRSVKFYNLNSNFNGTNIQTIKISNDPSFKLNKNFTDWLLMTRTPNDSYHLLTRNKYNRHQVFSFKEIFTKFLLPIFMFIIFIFFLIITVIFCRKEQMKRKFFQLPTMDYLASKTCGSKLKETKHQTTKLSCKKIIKAKSYKNNLETDTQKKPFSKLKNFLNISKINKNRNRRFQLSNIRNKSGLVTFKSTKIVKDEPVCNSYNYKDEILEEKLNFDITKFIELNTKLNSLTKDSGQVSNRQSSNNCSIYNNSSTNTYQTNSKKSQSKTINEKTDLIKSLKKNEGNFNENRFSDNKIKTIRNFIQKFNISKSKNHVNKYKNNILKLNHSNSQSSYFKSHPVQIQSGILKSFSNQSFNQKGSTSGASKHRNNYLYFNYNNNKMHYLNNDTDLIINDSNAYSNNNLANDITISNQNLLVSPILKSTDSGGGSTLNSNSNQANAPMSLSTNTKYILANKFKRLSGTEV